MPAKCCHYGFTIRSKIMTPVPDGLADSMLAAMRSRVAMQTSKVTLLALVDGALLRNLPSRQRQRWPVEVGRSLLPPGTAASAGEVGPLLFELPASLIDSALVQSVIDPGSALLAGSFLLASTGLDTVAKVLSPFIDAQLADGTELVMRFYDPRILPLWLDGLPDAYLSHIGSAVSHWLYWDLDHRIRAVEFSDLLVNGNGVADAEFPVRISVQREAQLMAASTPHLVIGRLLREGADVLRPIPPAERYDFVRSQLERATAHGLSTLRDLEAYCGLAVALGKCFDTDSAMESALHDVKAGLPFDKAIAALKDTDWDRLREAVQ